MSTFSLLYGIPIRCRPDLHCPVYTNLTTAHEIDFSVSDFLLFELTTLFYALQSPFSVHNTVYMKLQLQQRLCQ